MRRRKYLVEVDVKLMSIHTPFEMTTNAILRKILVIARNRTARFGVSSAPKAPARIKLKLRLITLLGLLRNKVWTKGE